MVVKSEKNVNINNYCKEAKRNNEMNIMIIIIIIACVNNIIIIVRVNG